MNYACTIELLGGLRVRQRDQVIARFRTQKTGTLLAYLACYLRRTHPREELIELLWPDTDVESGRMSLRTALASLRRQLEPPGTPDNSILIADRSSVHLNPEAVATDLSEFEAALQAANRLADPAERVEWLDPRGRTLSRACAARLV
jgi:DNA-binding SARP family transcriptional activator